MYLVGDIGGTKTLLALSHPGAKRPEITEIQSFPSDKDRDLMATIEAFLGDKKNRVQGICLGIAGTIKGNICKATNIPWVIDGQALSAHFSAPVRLLNDLEALGHTIQYLEKDELHTLNTGISQPGNRALIAAGTGLGQTILFWDGKSHRVSASEGGHCDFAPRNAIQIALLEFLMDIWGHVSVERVVSGMGLVSIYAFLRDMGVDGDERLYQKLKAGEGAALITEAARHQRCKRAEETIAFFLECYAAEVGNLALKAMAKGGIYIGGGIAPKLLDEIISGPFLDHCFDKGRFSADIRDMPIHVIRNEEAALLGSAAVAQGLS